MCSYNVLYHDIRMNEVRANPRRIENSSRILKENHTDNVIANMTLLINLERERERERKREKERERERERGGGREIERERDMTSYESAR